jgi:putative endonuclease
MTNKSHTVLYTGVTNNIERRVDEHRSGNGSAFTRRYHATELVHLEYFNDIAEAIRREKQIKAGSRKRKTDLTEQHNPTWKNLL